MKLVGGPSSNKGSFDANLIFTSSNQDIQNMNSLIKEHMSLQNFNHQMGVNVNNFDQSPAPGETGDKLRFHESQKSAEFVSN